MASLGSLKAIKKEAWRLQLQCTRVVDGSRRQTNFWSGDETRGGAGITTLRVVCTCKLSSNDVITNDVISVITTTDTVSTVSVETVEAILIVETVCKAAGSEAAGAA